MQINYTVTHSYTYFEKWLENTTEILDFSVCGYVMVVALELKTLCDFDSITISLF